MHPIENVYDLYGSRWGSAITKASVSHPAKYSPKLIKWIISTGIDRGYWQPGDLILDPFGGIGTGGIVAADNWINWLGVELEPRFVKMARDNFAIHQPRWQDDGAPEPLIVQGDSRQFASIVRDQLDAGAIPSLYNPPLAAISSPPYANRVDDHGTGPVATKMKDDVYGSTVGQMGNLRTGAVTSPPYADMDTSRSHTQGKSRTDPNSPNYRPFAVRTFSEYEQAREYGHTPGQIGALKAGAITSPPFSQPEARDRYAVQDGVISDTITRATTIDRQGQMEANISRLNGITSPPYEGSVIKARSGHLEAARLEAKGLNDQPRGLLSSGEHALEAYSHDKANLGNETGETYWDAVEQVYREVHDVLSPGGVFAVVVKDFVKNKQRVPLVDMTRELLERIGFKTLMESRAMVVSEDGTKSHKSFFRRLAESKGSPAIDWEVVLWLERQ